MAQSRRQEKPSKLIDELDPVANWQLILQLKESKMIFSVLILCKIL